MICAGLIRINFVNNDIWRSRGIYSQPNCEATQLPPNRLRMSVAPAERLLAKPFWSMVATLVSPDCHVNSTPGTSLLPASNARAVNCCRAPAVIVAEDGETSTREIAGVHKLNAAPLICVPGLKARAPLLAARCCKAAGNIRRASN